MLASARMRVAGFVSMLSIACVPACRRGPPEQLVPPHAVVLRELGSHEDQCSSSRTWVLRATAADVDVWAKENDLPCASGTTPCTQWSTSKRASPFWKNNGALKGLDSVDAKLEGGEVTIDWGHYTCGGPN